MWVGSYDLYILIMLRENITGLLRDSLRAEFIEQQLPLQPPNCFTRQQSLQQSPQQPPQQPL